MISASIAETKEELIKCAESIDARRGKWIYTPVGNFYIRSQGHYYIEGAIRKCFNFSNVLIHPEYQSQGIFTDILNWAIDTLEGVDAVLVESIVNYRLKVSLLRKGWIPHNPHNGYFDNVYKPTKSGLLVVPQHTQDVGVLAMLPDELRLSLMAI